MTSIITPGALQQPRIVTLAELKQKLLPLCYGWKWAEDAIGDLWQRGAPVPVGPDQPEQRILLPGQFRIWWGEIQQRMGLPTPGDTMYGRVTSTFRHSNVGRGQRRR